MKTVVLKLLSLRMLFILAVFIRDCLAVVEREIAKRNLSKYYRCHHD